VLDRDPRTVLPEQLLTMEVVATIVDGKIVYQVKDAPAAAH
jgi:predicted amidohydrolase YtcJ